MPNWCECDLSISGPDVPAVLAAVRSETSLFDFCNLIPYPEKYRRLDERNQEYIERWMAIPQDDPERAEKLAALASEYGVQSGAPWLRDGYNSGGYEWCCEHWGTKWPASQIVIETAPDEPRSAVIHFDTAWCPPLPVIRALAERFPNHAYCLEYYEGGVGFCGKVQFRDGAEISHWCDDYSGERGG